MATATMTRTAGAPSRLIPALDGIRGVAIICVLFHNVAGFTVAPYSRWLSLFPFLISRGWIGVELFFALSGFLITGGLLDSQHSPHYFRNFYARRALRILPLYYAVLFVLLVVLPRFIAVPYSNQGQAPLWLFVGNFTEFLPYGFGHFWSLAVEEQFYLFWPLVVWRLAPRRLLTTCLWISAGALLLRCILAAHGVSSWTLYANTACRMDALALGGAGACVMRIPALRDAVRQREAAVAAAVLLVFLSGLPLTHLYDFRSLAGGTFGYSLLAIAFGGLVTWAAALDGRGPLGVRSLLKLSVLRSCGRYSYAMYIFHNLLHKLLGEPWLIARFGKQPSLSIALVYGFVVLLVTYFLAFCSYHALEKHFLKLKRFFPGRRELRDRLLPDV